MKKSIEIIAHLFLWTGFTLLVLVFCKIYLRAKPDAPFAPHLAYVVFLELAMGLIFFYTTFIGIAQVRRKRINIFVLAGILLFLLLLFAYPAFSHGTLEVMSSIIPHLMIIFLAIIFRGFSDSYKFEKQ